MARISANPTGGVVVQGEAQILGIQPGLTTIHQQTDRAVIDWSSFNIAAGERTQFIVPDVTSATLNRVLDGGPSLIDGTLTSNGQVFLINASGVVFGRGAVVDVAGLTASTLDLSNRMFMAGGPMAFSGSSTAGVTNAGSIRASSGDVFLIGFQVHNSGAIRAPNGTVGLAAGTDVLIMPAGDERVIVRNAAGPQRRTGVSNSGLIEANVAELKAHGGNVYALAIRNTGRIAATAATKQGGRILLSAPGGQIDNRGTLVARGPSGNGGQIRIDAGSSGKVGLGGRVDANGTTGKGGSISVNGGEVTVRRAIRVTAEGETAGGQIDINATAQSSANTAALATVIDGTISADSAGGKGGVIRLGGSTLTLGGTALISASGAAGGGSLLVGGGAQGLDASMANATQVQIQSGAVLAADATRSGSGGSVVVFASGTLTFNGVLQARGGALGGDGGQAEISGKQALVLESLSGHIDLSSPRGRAGSLLLDPNDILISDCVPGTTISNPAQANYLKASDISCWLDANCGSLIIQTDRGAGGGAGNITLEGVIQWSSATNLIIQADRDFIMSTQETGSSSILSQGSGDVTITAGRSLQMQAGAQILTDSGNVTISANQNATNFPGDFHAIVIGGQIATVSGDITLAGRAGDTGGAGTAAIWIMDSGTLSTQGGRSGIITLQTTGGPVVGDGAVTTENLKLAGAGGFYFNAADSAIETLVTVGGIGSLQLVNSLGLTIGSIGADSGLSAAGDISITTTNTDHIRINQALTSQGGTMVLNAFGIEVNGSRVSTTGSGAIFLTAAREIDVNSGAAISVVDGKLELNANQSTTPTGGTFAGIILNNATLTSSGKGAIELNGHGGDTGSGNVGILMQHGSTIRSTSTAAGAGGITLYGTSGGGDSGNKGVAMQDAGTAISTASSSAAIAITASGLGTGVANAGVDLGAQTAITSPAAMIISTDSVAISGAATVGGSGSLAIRTVSAGTSIGLGDGAAGSLLIDSAGIGALASTLSHVTIGAADSGYVDVRSSTWRAPLTILTLGEIAVSGQLVDLAGSVTLNGADTVLGGGITSAGGVILISTHVTLSASSTLDSTGGGTVANGAAITITGAINDGSSGHDLTLNAGLTGDVSLQSSVGQSAAPRTVSLTGGRLAGAPEIHAQTFSATFNGVMDLSHLTADSVSVTGRSGNDTVMLSAQPASLAVNGGGGTDTVSFAAATGPVSLSAASFTSIENLIGSASQADTLVGAAGGSVFLITANNAGTLGTMHFSSIENLTGSSTGANQFTFTNQAVLDGGVSGGGNPQTVLVINDSNLQSGQTYIIGESLITVGTRSYAFTGVNTVGLSLGAGNDNAATSFYTFAQNLSGGGGTDQLFVDGTKEVTSPLTKPGFGTISTTGFSTSTVIFPVTNVFLQNFNPGGGGGGASSSQTNNFNSAGVAGGLGGLGAQGAAGALAGGAGIAATASTSSFLGQTFGTGSGSMGGGGPASLGTQSQLSNSTSATAERELNMSLGGDGTIRLQNGGGQMSIGAGGGAASTGTTAQLNAGMSLLAQSELAIGAIGNGEVPLTVQAGAQSINIGNPVPSLVVQQFLNQVTSPESFSTLVKALGGDGTARLEFISGSSTIEVNGKLVPSKIENVLLASISPGAFGELASALGGRGDYVVTDSMGLAVMDASGAPAPPEVQTHLHALLGAPGAQALSLALGEEGTALVVSWDGMENTTLDGTAPGPFVILKLNNATTPQSQEELDHALR
ncbi:beta strand repeat-containing protein [Prosthecobacter sp.]|uniref:beta strand repeat-containing protein n=1 Tax=Prosthecobacter sp. TaxID=1965333 RepID=UPI0037850AB6